MMEQRRSNLHLKAIPIMARLHFWRPSLLTACTCWLLLAGAGCAASDDAEFTIGSVERYEECLTTASPIRPKMLAARERVNTIGVFMQTDHRLPSVSDLVYLEVYQPKLVRSRLGEPFELADPLELEDDEEFDEPPVIRGVIAFSETCPELKETFALRGTVVFNQLGAENGAIVQGELVDGVIVSTRDENVVARDVTGSWEFTVDTRRPNQYFPSYREEIPRGPLP
ncbi:hypothetical protein FIV42_02495 [Persicimonas caeni]|uniref:Carboxypeptidase regulatory-like domain-containing protein n=1 Tax=Persicimonas caeni TaxID=2292766 RepID=A0A4Y6PMV3_PERCE|nr:hypothetical protein [Persicimonas caeni]QDG49648.1 hypothetical protein FIV42_02495 [Persicimonas caeni]QED30869.1 hypothetical protein FRD00_02490 [Persicimonas caeni]